MDQKVLDHKVLSLFMRMAGDDTKQISATVQQLVKQGKTRQRAMADALFYYGRGGAVN